MSSPKTVDQYFAMLDSFAKNSKAVITEENPKKNAIRFRGAVLYNIVTQKFASSFRRLNPKYVESKKEQGAQLGFWRFHDSLLRSLSAFKRFVGGKKYWIGGVIPGTTNENGENITEYGLIVEHGKGKVPSRPMFGLSTNEYAEGKWKEVGKETLKKITSFWS